MSLLRRVSAAVMALSLIVSSEAALPGSGNCSTFSVNGNNLPPLGDQSQNIPNASFQLKVSDFTATKAGSSVNLGLQGITNQFTGDNDGVRGAGAWYVIYRCDIANGQFVQLTDHTHASTVAGTVSNLTFTDSSLGANPQSKYHYVAFGLMSTTVSFGTVNPSAGTDADSFSTSLSRYVTGTANTKITWSDPVFAEADFRPVQNLAITANPAVGTVNGMVGQASVSQTFSATIDASLVASPSYVWTTSGLPDGLTTATAGNQTTISGTYTTPGVFNASVGVSATSSHTTSVAQTYVILPVSLAFTSPASSLSSVQVSKVTSYELTTQNGMAAADPTNYEVAYTIQNQTLAGAATTVASVVGGKLMIDLSNVATTGQALSVTVVAADVCKTGGTCRNELLSSATRVFTASTANEFKFSNNVLAAASAFQANPANIATYAQIRLGGNPSSYTVGLEGQGATVSNTYSIVSGATATGTAIAALSQIGLQFVTSTAGGAVISEVSSGSATASIGSTFALNMSFTSPGSSPAATIATVVPFIVLDGAAPTVVATPVFAEFAWGVQAGAKVLPILSAARTLMVTYSKNLQTAPRANITFADGSMLSNLSGIIQNDAKVVHYSVDLSSLATRVFPQGTQDLLDVSAISFDSSGKDLQSTTVLQQFSNDTVAAQYTNTGYRIVNPLKVVTTSLGTGVKATATLEIRLNKMAVVNGNSSIISGIGNPNVTSKNESGVTVILVAPATRFNYASSGLTVVSTQVLASGLPLLDASDAAANQAVSVTIENDTYKPNLISDVSRISSASSTDVTFVAAFDEALNGTCTATVGGANAACTVAGQVVTVVATGLAYNRSLPVVITVSDTSANGASVNFTYVTLDQSEVVAPVADTNAPFVLSLTPDLKDPAAGNGLSLLPVINVEFSENVTGGNVTLMGSAAINTQVNGTGGFRSISPSVQLTAGTTYTLNLSGFIDSSNNTMTPVSFTFTTAQANQTIPAPTLASSNVAGVSISVDSPLSFLFSESLNLDSLAGFSLTSGTGTVEGVWSVSGKVHTFRPAVNLQPSVSYSYNFTTAVKSVRGVALSAPVSGSFSTLASAAPKEFAVNVSAVGSSHVATATWVVGSGTVDHYAVSYRASNDLSFSGNATQLTTVAAAAGAAKLTTSGTLNGVTAGQNVQFVLNAMSATNVAVATATVTVLALPSQNDVIQKQLISVASNAVVTVAVEIPSGDVVAPVQLKVDPKALQTSAEFSIQTISDPTAKSRLTALGGGGRKVVDPVQFGPDGKIFLKPVEIGLRFNPTTLGSTDPLVLSTMLTPVFVNPVTGRWDTQGLAFGRVEVVDADEAVLYLLTTHFSAFSVGEALRFVTNQGALTIASNQASVQWSASVTPGDLSIAVSGTGATQLSTSPILAAGSSVNTTGFTIAVPEVVTSDINVTYTVTIRDGATTATGTFTVTKLATGGSTTFAGTPRNVDSFSVKLSGASTATLSWTLTSDSDRQVDTVNVELSRKLVSSTGAVSYTTPETYSFNRSLTTTTIAGLDSNSIYRYTAFTKSQQGNRSLSSGDITRYTFFGLATQTLAASASATLTGTDGLSVVFSVTGTNPVEVSRYSSTALSTLTGTGKILATTIALSNGQTLVQTGLFELSFTGPSSVTITMAGTFPGHIISHYDEAKTAWEYLGSSNGMPLQATVAGAGSNSVITITATTAAGSPFALSRPLPLKEDDGGGCLTVAGSHVNPVHGWLNFLLMLMPLGYFFIRRKL